jgi:hypothetical protein
LLDLLPDAGFGRLRLAALPAAGLHVDVPARWLGIWTSEWIPGVLPALPTLWPGWSVRVWADRYEDQLRAADRIVSVPACDERLALEKLTELLTSRSTLPKRPAGLYAESVKPHRPASHSSLDPLARVIRKVAADLDNDRACPT